MASKSHRRRVVIRLESPNPVPTRDEHGHTNQQYVYSGRCYADVKQRRMNEADTEPQTTGTAVWEFTVMRSCSTNMDSATRIIWDGRVFNVTGINPLPGRGRQAMVTATEDTSPRKANEPT